MLTFALVFSSCRTLADMMIGQTEVETETSGMLKNAAIDILLSQGGSMAIPTFRMAFERQFSGIQWRESTDPLAFFYQDKEYRLSYTATGGSLSVDGPTALAIISFTSCVEVQKKQ